MACPPTSATWVTAESDLTDESMRDRIVELAVAQWRQKEALAGADVLRQFERSLMLQTLDQHWREHLANLDHLRQGIHLRGYAQKNPKQEYKREAFELFSDMLDRIKHDVVKIMLTVQVRTQEDVQAVEEPAPVTNVRYQHADYEEALGNGNGGQRRRRHRRRDCAAEGRPVRARRREGGSQRSRARAAAARSTNSVTADSASGAMSAAIEPRRP